mmetsp:Transcript_131203/g.195524  ORF Transcript_131203/g.195524 Transcript_131203/m.195524 type:complete len:291 (+) Transcript_131203:31-903(+)|eukprot:CAMPEP_0117015800 /NCGR_PEP_ID=MMETSP0472-20121206/12548_1 /TAXON_ID=693140 ORGANISM="Tiarina fusus, Strain LIS" /NCGR_SAMPLE_ID=MMETSP0472 /ASSEMBLY_ACC=CAM_ASM_000603 /LENGTH=290 /DNA_ID=CAMNT_0004719667 /DNA_START=26 /DNA_END=898 /DNA_ORIENTATION=+
MSKKLDGRAISAQIHEELAESVKKLKEEGINPSLAVIQVGDRPDSSTYIRMKKVAAEKVGITFLLVSFAESASQQDIIDKIEEINNDESIHGLIIQLPLPEHIDEATVTRLVSCDKDVDGFHIENIGALVLRGQVPKFVSCTPKGCLELLIRSGVTIEGKDVVVIGRSNIVGLPVAHLLLQQNATVTICHSRTKDLPGKCKAADIVVAAIGQPEFVKGDWIKEGAVVVDVGINSIPDESRKSGYRLVGDVDFEGASARASLISPVPGGVGPMTVAMLLSNTVESALRSKK